MLSFRFVHVKIYWSICIKNFLTLFDSSVGDSHGTSAKIIDDYEIRITWMIYIRHRWVYSSTYRMVFRELSNLKISEMKMFFMSDVFDMIKIMISTLSKKLSNQLYLYWCTLHLSTFLFLHLGLSHDLSIRSLSCVYWIESIEENELISNLKDNQIS